MGTKAVLVTGANGYIGNAVARAFAREGWTTYGLVRASSAAEVLQIDEVLPVIGSIDNPEDYDRILAQLPEDLKLDAVVSTTEVITNYVPHYGKILALLRRIAMAVTHNGHPKPLLIFTSGVKDYGVKPHIHGTAGMVPHTEESPLDPPAAAADRATYAAKILGHADVFAPVLVRPTNVYGRTSSYFHGFFDVAKRASEEDSALIVPVDKNFVLHALHVDDCGEAYVSIASHSRREQVEGQVFNMSGHKYETVEEVMDALVSEYGISRGVQYVEADHLAPSENPWPPLLLDFPQWVDSGKLRCLTGWRDKRPLFSEGLKIYRGAYEASLASAGSGNEVVKRMQERVQDLYTALKR